MARLIDEIRAHGWQLPGMARAIQGNDPSGAPAAVVKKMESEVAGLLQLLRKYPPEVLAVDNVARYAAEVMEAQGSYIDQYPWELPCVMPPFQNIWVEYRMSAHVRETIRAKSPQSGSMHWKGVAAAFHLYDAEQSEVFEEFRGRHPEFPARHVLIMHSFLKGTSMMYPDALAHLFLTEDGEASPGVFYSSYVLDDDALSRMGDRLAADAIDSMRAVTWTLTSPLFLGLAFCHCKNVQLLDRGSEPDEKKKREPKGPKSTKRKKPLVRYRVLSIDPMRTVLKNDADPVKTGIARALHICRGHFKTYSPDNPLFGKLAGTFWIPAHLRGSKKQGLVLKDYEVEGPIINN